MNEELEIKHYNDLMEEYTKRFESLTDDRSYSEIYSLSQTELKDLRNDLANLRKDIIDNQISIFRKVNRGRNGLIRTTTYSDYDISQLAKLRDLLEYVDKKFAVVDLIYAKKSRDFLNESKEMSTLYNKRKEQERDIKRLAENVDLYKYYLSDDTLSADKKEHFDKLGTEYSDKRANLTETEKFNYENELAAAEDVIKNYKESNEELTKNISEHQSIRDRIKNGGEFRSITEDLDKIIAKARVDKTEEDIDKQVHNEVQRVISNREKISEYRIEYEELSRKYNTYESMFTVPYIELSNTIEELYKLGYSIKNSQMDIFKYVNRTEKGQIKAPEFTDADIVALNDLMLLSNEIYDQAGKLLSVKNIRTHDMYAESCEVVAIDRRIKTNEFNIETKKKLIEEYQKALEENSLTYSDINRFKNSGYIIGNELTPERRFEYENNIEALKRTIEINKDINEQLSSEKEAHEKIFNTIKNGGLTPKYRSLILAEQQRRERKEGKTPDTKMEITTSKEPTPANLTTDVEEPTPATLVKDLDEDIPTLYGEYNKLKDQIDDLVLQVKNNAGEEKRKELFDLKNKKKEYLNKFSQDLYGEDYSGLLIDTSKIEKEIEDKYGFGKQEVPEIPEVEEPTPATLVKDLDEDIPTLYGEYNKLKDQIDDLVLQVKNNAGEEKRKELFDLKNKKKEYLNKFSQDLYREDYSGPLIDTSEIEKEIEDKYNIVVCEPILSENDVKGNTTVITPSGEKGNGETLPIDEALAEEEKDKEKEVKEKDKEKSKKFNFLKNDPKLTKKTAAMIGAGVLIGVGVRFIPGPLGIITLDAAGIAATKIIDKKRKALKTARLNGVGGPVEVVSTEEPKSKIKQKYNEVKAYLKSEEGLRDMEWMVIAAMVTGTSLKIGQGIAKLNAGKGAAVSKSLTQEEVNMIDAAIKAHNEEMTLKLGGSKL